MPQSISVSALRLFGLPESTVGRIINECHQLLLKRQLTVSTAESCTGGLVGTLLTANPGASAYFRGGVIAYANDAKIRLLGVDKNVLTKEGAVSAAVAEAMAEGARRIFSSDIAVSVTGIAGPDGGTEAKPVGTFYVGFSSAEKTMVSHFYYSSTRHGVQSFAAYTALDTIRRVLLGYPLSCF